MHTKHTKAAMFALGAFMAAWQATDFSLDYRAVMGAVTAAVFAAMNPDKTHKTA